MRAEAARGQAVGPASRRLFFSHLLDMAPAKQQQPKFVLKRKGAPGAGEHDAKRVRIAGDGAGPKPKPKPKGVPPPALKGKGKAKTLPEPAAAPKPKPVKTLKAKVAAAPPVPAPLPRAFTVVAGSYEKLLYGLSGTVALCGPSSAALAFALAPIFIFPAHAGAVKALGASPGGGKWLATGSADEVIKVWDLRRRREVGGLLHHAGSITALQFAGRAHLLSASEDGALALFHARDWALLRTLAGHKGRVNALAVHPSGKLALSVGRDRTLRMWDLLRGRAAASTKIYKGTRAGPHSR
jgi:protein MAK11